MKRLRRLVAIVLMFALCVQCIPSHAEEASVMSANVNSATIGISFSNGNAKKGSTIVRNWKVGTLTNILNVDRKAAVSKGTYTLTLNVNAFRNGVPETVNVSVTDTYK